MRKQEETRLAEVAAEKTQYLAIQAEGEIVSNLIFLFHLLSTFLCVLAAQFQGRRRLETIVYFPTQKLDYMCCLFFFLGIHELT